MINYRPAGDSGLAIEVGLKPPLVGEEQDISLSTDAVYPWLSLDSL